MFAAGIGPALKWRHVALLCYCAIVSLLMVDQGPALARGEIIDIDVEGAKATYPLSINIKGAVTGYWLDDNFNEHGFRRSANGAIKTFDVRKSDSTQPACINGK